MIFFVDKNSPSYLGAQKYRETYKSYVEASDNERLDYIENFIKDFEREFECSPNSFLIESMANLLLRPYIGDKSMEYKILSVFSLERREQKQVKYIE